MPKDTKFNQHLSHFLFFLFVATTNYLYALSPLRWLIANDKCLSVKSESYGGKLVAEKCNSNSKQQFVYTNSYLSPGSNSSLCLTVASEAINSFIYLWPCASSNSNDSSKQQFSFIDNKLKLSSVNNLCLDNSNDDGVKLSDCTTSQSQIISKEIQIESASHKCAELENDNRGSELYLRDCFSSNKQKFFYNGKQIKSATNISMCLDSFIDFSFSDESTIYSKLPINIFLNNCDRTQENKNQTFSFKDGFIVRQDNSNLCIGQRRIDNKQKLVLDKCTSSNLQSFSMS